MVSLKRSNRKPLSLPLLLLVTALAALWTEPVYGQDGLQKVVATNLRGFCSDKIPRKTSAPHGLIRFPGSPATRSTISYHFFHKAATGNEELSFNFRLAKNGYPVVEILEKATNKRDKWPGLPLTGDVAGLVAGMPPKIYLKQGQTVWEYPNLYASPTVKIGTACASMSVPGLCGDIITAFPEKKDTKTSTYVYSYKIVGATKEHTLSAYLSEEKKDIGTPLKSKENALIRGISPTEVFEVEQSVSSDDLETEAKEMSSNAIAFVEADDQSVACTFTKKFGKHELTKYLPTLNAKLNVQCMHLSVFFGCPQPFCWGNSLDAVAASRAEGPAEQNMVVYRGHYTWTYTPTEIKKRPYPLPSFTRMKALQPTDESFPDAVEVHFGATADKDFKYIFKGKTVFVNKKVDTDKPLDLNVVFKGLPQNFDYVDVAVSNGNIMTLFAAYQYFEFDTMDPATGYWSKSGGTVQGQNIGDHYSGLPGNLDAGVFLKEWLFFKFEWYYEKAAPPVAPAPRSGWDSDYSEYSDNSDSDSFEDSEYDGNYDGNYDDSRAKRQEPEAAPPPQKDKFKGQVMFGAASPNTSYGFFDHGKGCPYTKEELAKIIGRIPKAPAKVPATVPPKPIPPPPPPPPRTEETAPPPGKATTVGPGGNDTTKGGGGAGRNWMWLLLLLLLIPIAFCIYLCCCKKDAAAKDKEEEKKPEVEPVSAQAIPTDQEAAYKPEESPPSASEQTPAAEVSSEEGKGWDSQPEPPTPVPIGAGPAGETLSDPIVDEVKSGPAPGGSGPQTVRSGSDLDSSTSDPGASSVPRYEGAEDSHTLRSDLSPNVIS